MILPLLQLCQICTTARKKSITMIQFNVKFIIQIFMGWEKNLLVEESGVAIGMGMIILKLRTEALLKQTRTLMYKTIETNGNRYGHRGSSQGAAILREHGGMNNYVNEY